MFKLAITYLTFFWITILYIFQYLLVSISHVYVFVNSVKLKIKRTIFNLFFHRHISRQDFFIVLAWQPITPSRQAIQALMSKHLVFTAEARILIIFLVLINIIYIVNFYVQHYQNRPKQLSKNDRKRWYGMVCLTVIFIFLLGLIIFLFNHFLPPFKITWYVDGGDVDYFYTKIKDSINWRELLYYSWMGCLVSLLLLIFFISSRTGVKLKPGKLQSHETDYLKGSGF